MCSAAAASGGGSNYSGVSCILFLVWCCMVPCVQVSSNVKHVMMPSCPLKHIQLVLKYKYITFVQAQKPLCQWVQRVCISLHFCHRDSANYRYRLLSSVSKRVAQCHTMLKTISVQCKYALCHQVSNYLLIRVWSQVSNRLLAISMDCGLTVHLGSNPECHHTGYHLCPHQSAQTASQNNIHLRLRCCCSSRWNAEVHVSGSRHPRNPGQPSNVLQRIM